MSGTDKVKKKPWHQKQHLASKRRMQSQETQKQFIFFTQTCFFVKDIKVLTNAAPCMHYCGEYGKLDIYSQLN